MGINSFFSSKKNLEKTAFIINKDSQYIDTLLASWGQEKPFSSHEQLSEISKIMLIFNFYFIYIFIWSGLLFGYYKFQFGSRYPLIIGFVSGLLIASFGYYFFENTISTAIEKKTGKYIAFNPGGNFVIKNKHNSSNDKYSSIIPYDSLKTYAKEHNLELENLSNYLKDNQSNNESRFSHHLFNYQERLSSISGYLFITIISSCLFTAYHNKKCLRTQLPLAMMTGLLSIVGLNNWIYHSSLISSATASIYLLKGIFVTAFSLSLACVLVPFFI